MKRLWAEECGLVEQLGPSKAPSIRMKRPGVVLASKLAGRCQTRAVALRSGMAAGCDVLATGWTTDMEMLELTQVASVSLHWRARGVMEVPGTHSKQQGFIRKLVGNVVKTKHGLASYGTCGTWFSEDLNALPTPWRP